MAASYKKDNTLFLVFVGLISWTVPGAGYYLLNEKKRAIIVFVTVTLTFGLGLYVGSVGVIDYITSWPWYIAQMMTSPAVALLGRLGATGAYPVFGKPNEIGQIYTSIAGLLNLLCVVNEVYLAHIRSTKMEGG